MPPFPEVKPVNRFRAGVCALWYCQMIVRQLLQWDTESGNLQRFGFEYGNIAESLITQGRFADAMTAGSGPTAWMPPLLCWIYALAFSFGGGRTFLSAIVLVNLKALATTWCLWHFLQLAWQRWKWTGMLVSLILCQLWVECDHHRVFGEFDDTWWVNSLTFLALRQLLRPATSWGWGFACLAVLLPLASPSLTWAFSLALLVRAWNQPHSRRAIAGFLALCTLVTAAWTARNYLALGRVYPIKSNLWFDFLEANAWDDDGVLTSSFFLAYHPVNRNDVREEYVRLGEAAFLDQARADCARIPLDQWARRSLRRLYNATVVLQNDWDFYPSHNDLPTEDIQVLLKSKLLREKDEKYTWLFCLRDRLIVEDELRRLPIKYLAMVQESRTRCEDTLEWCHNWPRHRWGRIHFTLLPTLALVLLVARRLTAGEVREPILMYAFFLLPYVLVQHYCRYQVSVVWLQHFLILSALLPGRNRP